MGTVADGFNSAFRDYVVDGVPGSGINQPSKSELRALGGLIEAYAEATIAAAQLGGSGYFRTCDFDNTDTGSSATEYRYRAPAPLLIVNVRASLTTPGSTPTTVDVKIGGVSIFSTIVTVDASGGSTPDTTSVGSAAPMAIANGAILDDAEIDITVTRGTGAQGLKVTLIGVTTTAGLLTMPTYVNANAINVTESGFGSTSIPYPTSGIEAGDTAWLAVMFGGGVPNRPSGWTAAGGTVTFSGYQTFNCRLFYRTCDGSENGASVAVTNDGTGVALGLNEGMIVTTRGGPATGAPYEALATNAGTASTLAADSVTTTGDNERVVNFWLMSRNDGHTGNIDSTPDAGWTEAFDFGSGASDRLVVDTWSQPLPGTVSANSRTIGVATDFVVWSLALVPNP